MNQSFPAFVSFHSLNNCFAYAKSVTAINDTKDFSSVTEKLGGSLLGNFRMRSCENPNVYCDLQLFGHVPFTNVSINSVFAEVSGFQEKQEVILEPIDTKTFCSYIEVAPRTENDYSVIAQSQASIENDFLNQIRLVSQNMIIPYFLSPGVHVQLRILNIVPATNRPVMLNNETELHVQTVTEGSQHEEKSQMAQKVSNIVQDLSTRGFLSNLIIDIAKPPLVARVLPKEIVECWIKKRMKKIDKSTIYVLGSRNCHYSERGIVEVRSHSRIEGNDRAQFFYLHRTAYTSKKNDVLNYALTHMFDSLQTHLTDRVHCVDGSLSLEPYANVKIFGVPENRVCTLRFCEILIEKETLQWLEEYDLISLLTKSLQAKLQGNPILLSVEGKNFDIALEDKIICLKIVPSIKGLLKRVTERTCFLLDLTTQLTYKKITIEPKKKVTELDGSRRRKRRGEENESDSKQETSSDNFALTLAEDFVQIGTHSKMLSELDRVCAPGNHALVLGATGLGKTTFVYKLARRLSYNSSVTFCKLIPCALLKGRSVDTIDKLLNEILNEMENKKPSCLILDDLDVILPRIDQEHRHLAMEKVVSMFTQKLRTTDVSVILVAQRLSSLNDSFVEQVMRSRPIVSRKVELAALNKDDRREMFEAYLDGDYSTKVLADIVQKSDGYTFNEIEKLATSINVECAIRGLENIEQVDVDKAFDCFVAGKTGKIEDDQVLPTLDDVGGMYKQKELLEQVIHWPKKYPQLFKSVGVPVSKGILLHGPSGCGKTFLANATIANSNFSVVNVKGPELLSKYIGASEENVRLVFEKARACAPSILFFDELDSLAPKRGHDSTGVTDRVVNQLLTELDGAEGGMKGIIIIGCTSRIDLIDEALLRPGRFDHHIYCGQPSEEERLEIMKVLTKNIHCTGVDFISLAKQTDGWTGADLKLLFTNAQFFNARKIKTDGDGLEEDDVTIDAEAIESVFYDSVPKSKKSEIDKRIGQKITLA